ALEKLAILGFNDLVSDNANRPNFSKILLYGPPGCGQRIIANRIANQMGSYLLILDSSLSLTYP
ncbi:hypothetical protein FWK35_00037201, partial [Aphis craccivora]